MLHVVVLGGHHALRVQPAASLKHRDQLPRSDTVCGEVADCVKQANATLRTDAGHGSHVLGHELSGLWTLEVRQGGSGQRGSSRQVVKVSNDDRVLRGRVKLGGVRKDSFGDAQPSGVNVAFEMAASSDARNMVA